MDFNEIISIYDKKFEEIKGQFIEKISYWRKDEIRSTNEILNIIYRYLSELQRNSEEEEKKPYRTSIMEGKCLTETRILASGIFQLIPIKSDNYEIYLKLMSNYYFANWSYCYESELDITSDNDYWNAEIQKTRYLGLVEFNIHRFNSFYANEAAILKLCSKYPVDIEFNQEEKVRIADALYIHVSNAGTPNDFGYAYDGIKLIETHIGNLPEEIIVLLCKNYTLTSVISNIVMRKQICAVINFAKLPKEQKEIYKFFFIDSLCIADEINNLLAREYSDWEKFYHLSSLDFNRDNIEVFKNPTVNWTNRIENKRSCCIAKEKDSEIVIWLRKEKIEIEFQDKRIVLCGLKLDDWILNNVFSKDTLQKIANLLFHRSVEAGKTLLFSYAYFNRYRGCGPQVIDFDHQYCLQRENGRRVLVNNTKKQLEHFYGKNVYSMTCVVGKNGTGKTSIIELLKNTFFDLLEILSNTDIVCEDGYIPIRNYQQGKKIILEEDTRFFLAFRFGDENYYLTNMSDISISADNIKPYQVKMYSSLDELSKIVYFSGQVRSEQLSGMQAVGKELHSNLQHVIDFSDETKMIQRINAVVSKRDITSIEEKNRYINEDICYQLTMLKHMDKEKLCKYMDIEEVQTFKIMDSQAGYEVESIDVDLLDDVEQWEQIHLKYISSPNVFIGPFSSGQYAKFSFLARLFWYLQGGSKEKIFYNRLWKECGYDVMASRENILKENETVVIFIDEGELYYHPEWQRLYLSMIFDLIRQVDFTIKIQLIITTNSPFMISDILQDDIHYLKADEQVQITEKTFGQNIHVLLKENFFMNYTIGDYARQCIEGIIERLVDDEEKKLSKNIVEEWLADSNNSNMTEYERIDLLIQQIGEPVYRDKLLNLLHEKTEKESIDYRIRKLESDIREKQRLLDSLKNEVRRND